MTSVAHNDLSKDNKTDMCGMIFSLKTIFAAFGLIMEDMEQEHQDAEGYEAYFCMRMGSVYMPALNLLLSSINDLLDKVEATI